MLVTPAVQPAADEAFAALRSTLEAGQTVLPSRCSDIAKPNAGETAYVGTPVAPLLSLMQGVRDVDALLPHIACPVLLLTSAQDHVVAPEASDHLAARVSGPVERVTLERSFHVATLDHDAELIETAAVEFARKSTATA